MVPGFLDLPRFKVFYELLVAGCMQKVRIRHTLYITKSRESQNTCKLQVVNDSLIVGSQQYHWTLYLELPHFFLHFRSILLFLAAYFLYLACTFSVSFYGVA